VLSVVIPTLQAAPTLAATLDAVAASGVANEVVVVDGGSSDGTRAIAARHGARVVETTPGRGSQLATGAQAAAGDWLLFLHADSTPGDGFAAAVRGFLADPENRRRAGVFRYALDDPSPAAARLAALVNWRSRTLALPYGDQGLLIARAFYDSLGGFPSIPLMEDVSMIRRIGRRRLVHLDAAIVTSAERYRRHGYVLRPLRNLACLALYFMGVAPRRIARLYR
jgi:rSAM/selenodomain-associated transferase 2